MSSNMILVIVIAVLVLALLFWLLVGARRTRVEFTPPAEDTPAKRNQALIDAPPATVTAAATVPLADVGVVAPPIPVPVADPVAPSDDADDLTRLKGVGPKLADQLRTLGVASFSQIAAWTDADIDRIDAQLGRFQGRIRKDDWRTQARYLAAGDTAGYQAKFGNL